MCAASILHSPIPLRTESYFLQLLCFFWRKLSFPWFVPNSLIWPFSHWLTKLNCCSTEEYSHWTHSKLWRKFVTATCVLPVANTQIYFNFSSTSEIPEMHTSEFLYTTTVFPFPSWSTFLHNSTTLDHKPWGKKTQQETNCPTAFQGKIKPGKWKDAVFMSLWSLLNSTCKTKQF